MIANDTELTGTQERILYFQKLLAHMRVAAQPSQYPYMSGSYRAEIEKMHREVMEYLSRHASQSATAEAKPELAKV